MLSVSWLYFKRSISGATYKVRVVTYGFQMILYTGYPVSSGFEFLFLNFYFAVVIRRTVRRIILDFAIRRTKII